MAHDPDETAEERRIRKEAKRARKEEKKRKLAALEGGQDGDASTSGRPQGSASFVSAGDTSVMSTSSEPKQKKRTKKEKRAGKDPSVALQGEPSPQPESEDELNDQQPATPSKQTDRPAKKQKADQGSLDAAGKNASQGATSESSATTFRPSPSRAGMPPPFFPHHYKKAASTGINAADLPPGLDLSALTEQLGGGKATGSSSSAADQLARLNEVTSGSTFVLPDASASKSKAKGPTQSAFDAAILSMKGGSGSTSAPGRVKGTRSNEKISKSKEATIADAAGLSEKEILCRKLYQPHQLKWLEEAGVLKNVLRGKFTQDETEKMTEALRAFAAGNGMTEEEGIELLTDRTPSQAELYAELTSEMAASVEGRHLRSVRRFAVEHFHPGAKQGPWTQAQIEALAAAHAELGPKWAEIGKRIGRLARDCRTRWRDHGSQVKENRQSGRWSQEEVDKLQAAVEEQCQALGLSSDDKALPWSSIALRVGSRASNACFRKWDEIQLKKEKNKGDLLAKTQGVEMWYAPRDEKLLVER